MSAEFFCYNCVVRCAETPLISYHLAIVSESCNCFRIEAQRPFISYHPSCNCLGSKRDAGTSKAVAEAVGEDEGVLRCLINFVFVVCVGDTVCFDVVKWSHSGVYGVVVKTS